MWPFEPVRDVLRIGRLALEHWSAREGGFVLVSASPVTVSGRPSPRDLLASLAQLAGVSPKVPNKAVDIVVESAWMPVIGLELDTRFWSSAKLDSLLAHQLEQLYGAAHGGRWSLRHDYRAGAAFALGFGMAPDVMSALQHGIAGLGLRAASVQPALSWTWKRSVKERQAAQADWWVCVEQDRALVCHAEGKRIDHVNAGAATPRDLDEVLALLGVETLRSGLHESAISAVAVAWRGPAQGPRIRSGAAQNIRWTTWEPRSLSANARSPVPAGSARST